MLFEIICKKNQNSNYKGLFQKIAFTINFGLWEVPKIDNDDDDDDHDPMMIMMYFLHPKGAKFSQVEPHLAKFSK